MYLVQRGKFMKLRLIHFTPLSTPKRSVRLPYYVKLVAATKIITAIQYEVFVKISLGYIE